MNAKNAISGLLIAALLFLTACQPKQVKASPFQTFADEVASMVQTNWPSMHAVWPGYDYDKHNLILVSESQGVLINTKGITALSAQALEELEKPNPGGYAKLAYEGKPSIIMAIDDVEMQQADGAIETYKTATHELVHFYYQDKAVIHEQTDRTQRYPVEAGPRILRQMLYRRLIDAYENKGEAERHLAHAKHWLARYQNEFAQESMAIKSVDIAEASARQSENLGTFIGKKLDQEAFRQEAIKTIAKDEVFESADAESYEIGFVAALLLDERRPD